MIDKNIFRAYDIRGIVGKNLDNEIMRKIGLGVGTMMIRKKLGNELLIGNDTRSSSEELSKAFIEGITSTGINVTDVGATSFGVTLFSGWKLKKDIITFITASHKPFDWNGIKFFDKDCVGFFEEDNLEIGRIVIEEDFESSDRKGSVEKIDMKSEYIKYLKGKFKFEKKLKIVVDCGNGCTSLVVPDLLKDFENLEVIELFCNIDSKFSGRGSDVQEENLQPLKNKVIEENADFGFAFDGDGDRIGVVDNKGHVLETVHIGTILCENILSGKGKKVVANVESSMVLDKEVKKLGGEIIRIPVGHTFMMREALRSKAVFGSEASKHFVIPEYFPFDDAVVIGLKMCEIISTQGKLSDLTEKVKTYPNERMKFDCKDEIKFGVVENLKNKLSEKYDRVVTLDGIRVGFENGWVLIRASNTGPSIRITVEAKTPEKLAELKNKFSEFLIEEIKKCKQ
ncbi:MAG: phosphomannomutase/phosphoglucomutase [Candidatus Aenigmarchaeota archaeon]|nr:phosphomannomutase/phosphoglucomutase [Candidatus Aenigmarchaeota archaeon]